MDGHPLGLLLGESLSAGLQNPRCAHFSWMKKPDYNLGVLKCFPGDESLIWVDAEGHKMCIAFPAILDMDGSRLGPYNSNSNLSAAFQLTPLSDAPSCHGITYIPSEAVECSMAAMSVLQAIHAITEDRIRRADSTTSLPFFRVNERLSQMVFVVNTESLFVPSVTNSSFSTPYIRAENSNLVEQSYPGGSLKYYMNDVLVSIPNVRDGDGWLIMPHEYRSKLKDRSVVMVNAFLKLTVEDGGNRIYNVVLNSMQSYPVADIIEIVYGDCTL